MIKAILKKEGLVPTFVLPETSGGKIDTVYFKQRKNLVLVFLHSHSCEFCKRIVRAFRFFTSRYKEENAEVFFILAEKLEDARGFKDNLNLPFKVLVDERGSILTKFVGALVEEDKPLVAVFVIDRYGALVDQWFSSREEVFPNQEQFLASLNQVEIECPECGIYEWPA